MFLTKNHEQTILEISKGDYVASANEAFLTDRQAGELSKHTLDTYWHIFNPFLKYCNANSLKYIREITADFPRHYFLAYAESHNTGKAF